MKKIICTIIVIACLLGLFACGTTTDGPFAKPDSGSFTISEYEIRKYLEESTGMWEFAQRFFDDTIIYKSSKAGGWAFEPVDTSMPLSDYNWDYLRHAGPIGNTEWEYYEGSELKSIKGIDVSVYQGNIDWAKVADDGVKFAYIRTGYRGYTEGVFALDSNFEKNITGALENGIAVGCYFVTRAISREEAIEEADWFYDQIKDYDFTWPVVLDLEAAGSIRARDNDLSAEDRTKYVIEFCERMKEHGVDTILYSNIGYFLDNLQLPRLTEYDKWFAQYFNRPFFPYEFYIWQYTSSGRVNGITGDVDLNICFKDYGKK